MISPGSTLRALREGKPLVHQITNYVVMNETANATLALGALPVMAHAREEVAEMTGIASALVLNIGTLSEQWIEAMLLAGAAANARGIPVVLDPVGVGATGYRTETAKRILGGVDVTVCAATQVRWRRSSARMRRCGGSNRCRRDRRGRACARGGAATRRRRVGDRRGRPRLRRRPRSRDLERSPAALVVTGTGACRRDDRLLPRGEAGEPLEAAAEALAAFGWRREDAAAARAGLERSTSRSTTRCPRLIRTTLDGRARIEVV